MTDVLQVSESYSSPYCLLEKASLPGSSDETCVVGLSLWHSIPLFQNMQVPQPYQDTYYFQFIGCPPLTVPLATLNITMSSIINLSKQILISYLGGKSLVMYFISCPHCTIC